MVSTGPRAAFFSFRVRRPQPRAGVLLLTLLLCSTSLVVPIAQSTNATVPGAVRSYATIYSIGIEWDLVGDADHDATAAVEFRVSGSSTWLRALPLVRVDFNGANTLAGSILFLIPNTTYEVRLTLNDPDGGAQTRTISIATRPLPTLPTSGRRFHVVPGPGGGDGSSANPFRGIGAAQATAQPGDIFLLHGGSYGGRIAFTKPGTSGQYIVWKGAGDGEALFAGVDVYASHVWLEGLTLRNEPYALMSKGAPTDVVISRSTFINNHYSIYLQQGGSDWYIADNTIVGDTPNTTESFDGEGIELNGGFSDSHGHVIAHNSITKVADGISNGDYNIDVYGNDIFDTSDDGFEGDPGGANIRVWGNRIHNAAHNGISFQPQEGAPWYILRNQLVSFKEAPFKFRTTDRSVIAHNTIVMWGEMICCNGAHLLRSVVKNNLWISVSGGRIWDFGSSGRDWRTDFNNDGFDWGGSTAPFRYGGVTYSTLSNFAAASGLETSGRQINKNSCFETFNVPGPPLTSIPAQHMTLKAGCNAVDAGAILPNINDGFLGAAPDLGAYELGQRLPTYGPRSAVTRTRGDFDGDGRTDLTVFRPSNGNWLTKKSSSGYTTWDIHQWAISGDVPMPGDYDGDGRTDPAVYRPSNGSWYVLKSSTNFASWTIIQWGLDADVPMPGDYDGDGRTDPAVYRPSNATWYLLKSSTNYGSWTIVQWGLTGDVPMPGDYDGDGKTDAAVYRPSNGNWLIKKSSSGYTTWDIYQWGLDGDVPMPGDYDGDGKTDMAVYRASNGSWYVLKSSTNSTGWMIQQWGLSGDEPTPGDYDGDGKTDFAVYRPSNGTWYLLQSSTNFTSWTIVQWGINGDRPVVQK